MLWGEENAEQHILCITINKLLHVAIYYFTFILIHSLGI